MFPLRGLQLLGLVSLVGFVTTKSEDGGTINDLFTDEEEVFKSKEYATLKDKITEEELTTENLSELFRRVEKRLERQLEKMRERGNDIIPVTTLDSIKNNGWKVPKGVADRVRKRGVLVVRETIPREEVDDMVTDLVNYMHRNEAFPKDTNQTVYEIYWSKSQMRARQHPNMLGVQKAILGMYHVRNEADTDVDLSRPAMYIDRLRIRPPGDAKFTLPPHVDGGGVERWKDKDYRQVYRKLAQGKLDEFDPFEVDYRVVANMNDFGYANGCTFFRAFQGWLSLGRSGPDMGTLRVFPDLKEATAYWWLRPFLKDIDSDTFPGCFPGKAFHISKRYHPLIYDNLMSIPHTEPGDTVWWHADLVHSVEKEHRGNEPSSVLYIPSGPYCKINNDYLRRMRHTFLSGETPPDFPKNDYEVKFSGRAGMNDVTPEGRDAMGWEEDAAASEETCGPK